MCSGSISAMAAMTTTARATRSCARSSARPAGRSASSSTCRARSCGSAVRGRRRRCSRRQALPPRPRRRRRAMRRRAPLPHPEIFGGAGARHQPAARRRQAAADGSTRSAPTHAETSVVIGGALSATARASTCPDVVAADLGADREGPRATCDFALELGVDWIALSFVQRPEDVAEARRADRRRAPRIMVKIEKPAAIERLDEHHRARRRGDGGARRSRRRDAAGGRAERCRSASSAPAAWPASRWSSRPRCWNRWSRRRRRPGPRPPTSRPRSMTAPTRSCCRPRPRRANTRSKRWR